VTTKAAATNPPRANAPEVAKRILTVLIPYCGAAWGIIQFADWLVNRYVLSPFLVDFCIYVAALLLPTAVLLAYFRGIPGPNPWTKAEKLGIPVNVVVAAVVLFAVFHGKELGAATKVVTAKDPAGSEVRREIAKPAFRKRVALFFFENQSAAQLNWMQQAITRLLSVDLSQDSFVIAFTPYNFIDRLKRAGLDQAAKCLWRSSWSWPGPPIWITSWPEP